METSLPNLTKKDLIHHVKSVNKPMSFEYLNSLTIEDLLAMAHPAYRNDYSKALLK